MYLFVFLENVYSKYLSSKFMAFKKLDSVSGTALHWQFKLNHEVWPFFIWPGITLHHQIKLETRTQNRNLWNWWNAGPCQPGAWGASKRRDWRRNPSDGHCRWSLAASQLFFFLSVLGYYNAQDHWFKILNFIELSPLFKVKATLLKGIDINAYPYPYP